MADMMPLRFLLVTILHVCVHSWILHTSHTDVVQNETTNVTLNCFYDGFDNGQSPIKSMSRVRILKLKDSAWKSFAETSSTTPTLSNYRTSVTSHVAKPRDSYLAVTWAKATNDTAGLYKCEVHGFDSKDEFVIARTSIVHIVGSLMSINQLNSMLIDFTKKTELENESLHKIVRILQENLKTFQNAFTNETLSLREELQSLHENKDTSEHSEGKFVKHYVEARNWPLGPAAFPAPKGECPQSAIDAWVPGYIKFSLRGTSPSPKISQGSHLLEPLHETIGSQRFAYMRSCRKTSKNGLDWPKGSYCINAAMTGLCPSHFVKRSLAITHPSATIEVEDKDPFSYYKYGNPRASIVAIFCCRDDGDAGEPMLLPTSWPFYLYRVNGTCQKVRFTDVTNEWAEMVTADYSVFFMEPGLRPDGSLEKGRLDLCYYSGYQTDP